MSNPIWDIQSAIHALLDNASPELAAGGVHAPALQNVGFPHVEIGESQTVTDDVQCSDGGDEFITLHVWSRPGAGGSYAEAKSMLAAMKTLIHGVGLAGDSLGTATAWVRSSRCFRDPDGVSIHGEMDVRIQFYS